ncbi:MAG: hypothetical protein ACLFRR_01815, partial [Spirochaetaceae bacterium]
MRHVVCLVVVAVALTGPVARPLRIGAGTIEATVRSSWEGYTVGRLDADFGAGRAVLSYDQEEERSSRPTAGVEAGPVLFGPFLLEGNVRRLRAPLGYTPGSGLWEEESGASLDVGIEPTGRLGARLTVRRGRLSVLGWEDGHSRTAAAVLRSAGYEAAVMPRGPAGVRPGPAAAGLELAGVVSETAANAPDERWYPEERPFAGGLLVHGVVRSVFGFGESLLLHADLFGVGGEHALPAAAGTLRLSAAGRFHETVLLAGMEHPAYRGRDGRLPSELAEAGLRTTVGRQPIRFGVEGGLAVADRPVAEEAVAEEA